ncbi:MAG: MBG domain-containing protein [Pyrinomonadaceae bacterium]
MLLDQSSTRFGESLIPCNRCSIFSRWLLAAVVAVIIVSLSGLQVHAGQIDIPGLVGSGAFGTSVTGQSNNNFAVFYVNLGSITGGGWIPIDFVANAAGMGSTVALNGNTGIPVHCTAGGSRFLGIDLDFPSDDADENPFDIALTGTGLVPGTLQFDAPSYSVSESASTVTLNVTRTGGSDGAVSVQYTTVDGTAVSGAGFDYTGASGTVSWANGDSSPKPIVITLLPDAVYEANEIFNVNILFTPTGGATLGTPNNVQLTILNDDPPLTTLVVNTTEDTDDGFCLPLGSGDGCTLREAINAANVADDVSTVNFNIPDADIGCIPMIGVSGEVCTIAPDSDLPGINFTTILNGYSQPGSSPNTLAVGNDAVIHIVLDGINAGAVFAGLVSVAAGSSIRGLSIIRFVAHALYLQAPIGTGAVAAGNFIGLDPTGASVNGSGGAGIYVDSGSSTIGGLLPADRNVISGNGFGIALLGTFTSGALIQGNYLGTDITGLLDLGNNNEGISIALGSNGNQIGGTVVAARNVISGNNGIGIRIVDDNSANNTVQGNYIGVGVNGTTPLGNGTEGIAIGGNINAAGNVLGGIGAGEANLIANNGSAGVGVAGGGGVRNTIRGNLIFNNMGLGIDLNADGVTSNDPNDTDIGPNNLQNFPVLTSAYVSGSTKSIRGILNTTPSSSAGYVIDFYTNSACDVSGNGEGETYLGSITTTTTDGSGNVAPFVFNPVSLTVSQFITATATDSHGNTSEFSQCFAVTTGTAGTIEFSGDPYPVAENVVGGNAAITIARIGGTEGSITATFSTADGTAVAPGDYGSVSQAVTFADGVGGTQTVNVPLVNEPLFELNETVNLNLTNTTVNRSDGSTELLAPEADSALLTITNDEPCNPTPVVTNIGDGGAGSLRQMVLEACPNTTITFSNTTAGGATNFHDGTPRTITLSLGELVIDKNLAVQGPGATLLAVSGNNTSRVFVIRPAILVEISRLTVTGGMAADCCDDSRRSGGGIYSEGNLNLVSSVVMGNTATGAGGGIANITPGTVTTITDTAIRSNTGPLGGGIVHSGNTLNLNGSTVSINSRSLTFNGAGGIFGGGTLNITNSTLSGNSVPSGTFNGGAIYWDNGNATITNSTITNNSAPIGVNNAGGIRKASGTVIIKSSIVAANANNATVADLGGSFVSQGYNLIGNVGTAIGLTATGDQAGTASARINPLLGPLANNGGPTLTHLPLFGSSAIDRGNNGTILVDQRGLARPFDDPVIANGVGNGSDIGAVEVQTACVLNPTVINNADTGAGSLRQAVIEACPGSVISFAGSVTSPLLIPTGQLSIIKDLTIDGPGADLLTLRNTTASGSPVGRVFLVTNGSVAINGLTLTGGNTNVGSGMVVAGGSAGPVSVSISNSTIAGNTASVNAAGIFASNATLNLTNSTVSNNVATSAGAGAGGIELTSGAIGNIINSTISGNTKAGGTSNNAGGIRVTGTLNLYNSTITNNSATGTGSASGVIFNGGTATIRSAIIAGNQNNATTADVLSNVPPVSSSGYNLIGSCTVACNTIGFTGAGDQFGTLAAPLDPRLLPLTSNGGRTETHGLCSAPGVPSGCTAVSPAYDKGNAFGLTLDQRGAGFPRTTNNPGIVPAAGGDDTDIGAYEIQNTPPTITAVAAARQAGSPVSNSTIANVTDAESGNGGVIVTVTTANPSNGVTISNIVNTAGVITADVVAACGATTATFTLIATDGGSLTASATLTVTVNPNTPPTVTYNNPAPIVFGQSGVTVPTATAMDNGSITGYAIHSIVPPLTTPPTVNASGVVSITNAQPIGAHVITVRSTDNCGAVTDSSFTLVVNKADTTTIVQTAQNAPVYGQSTTITASLVANAPGAGTPQGDVNFLDGATPIAACQNVTLNALGAAACSLNTLGAGTHTINVNYLGNANFNTSNGSAQQTVLKAPLNVTASSHNVTYGDAAPTITSTITGFVPGETSAVLLTQPTCLTTYTQGAGVNASPYSTTCAAGAAANYSFNYINGSINVAKKGLTVTADNKSKAYGAANPALTATLSGFVGADNAANSTTGTAGLTTTATAASPVGNYPITATLGTLASSNYSFATFTNATLTVTAVQLTVTANNRTRVYGAANPALTFTITGFQNGETLGTSGVMGAPNISTSAISTSAPGAYAITLTQGTLAAPNYVFTFVPATLTVTQAATTTTITNATALGNSTVIGQNYPVNWTTAPVAPGAGTPTGNVTVSDGTGNTCTAAVAAGTCSLTSTLGPKTITAAYAGDANFGASTSQVVQHNVVIAITGTIKQFGTNANLQGVTVALSGGAVETAVTDANGNYTFELATAGGSYIVTPSNVGKTYEPINRTYMNVTTSITSANFIEYGAEGSTSNPRNLSVGSSTITSANSSMTSPEQIVSVPVLLTSQGNEAKIDFSLNYDLAILGIPAVTCGADTSGCTVVVNNSLPGKVGISITPTSVVAAGTREIVRVTFPISTNNLITTPISFGDQPTMRDIRDADSNPLPSLFTPGVVGVAQGDLGLEGDIVNATGATTGGDGVLSNDVSIMRQLVLGTISPDFGNNQFQRADTSPRETFGDGRIDATDVTVARLYNLGVFPPTTAAGPTGPVTTGPDSPDVVGRIIRAVNTTGVAGQQVTVQFQLDSQGDEASASFTVNWNSAVLTYVSAAVGAGVPTGTNLGLNTSQTAQDRLGVLLDSTNTYAAGTRQILTVTFNVAPLPAGAPGTYPVTFSGTPTAQSMSNAQGALLATTYEAGNVVITTTAAGVRVSGRVTTAGGQALRNATVILTDSEGNRRTVTTGSFGIYTFDDVEAGQTYVVGVQAKRYRFVSRVVNVTDNVSDVNFVGRE